MSAPSERTMAIRKILSAHRELSSLEWIEFRRTIAEAGIWVAVAACTALVGWLVLNAAVVVALWRSPFAALGAVFGLNALVGGTAVFQVRRLLRTPFFATTRAEAERDVGAVLQVFS